ncbi:hypothetical protein SAMN05421875_11859 [Acidovorax soli]|uniref:Uncharacterized protein n=1 Tax=Acidovorax soli TaxID=592050 RepID=A0A1H4CCE0_9BURK|nr:hypothetical protein SAMN05421875_11859 [Acidovorax soli]
MFPSDLAGGPTSACALCAMRAPVFVAAATRRTE